MVVPTNDIERLCVGAEESQTVTSVFVYNGLGKHQITGQLPQFVINRYHMTYIMVKCYNFQLTQKQVGGERLAGMIG